MLVASIEPAHSEGWVNSESKDEMREITTLLSSLASTNTIDQAFPYEGASHLKLYLRKKAGDTDVMLVIDKGQMSCPSGGCVVQAKFDTGKVVELRATAATRNNAVFIKTPLTFIETVRRASQLIVEVPLYEAGMRQFKFSPSGLDWPVPEIKAGVFSVGVPPLNWGDSPAALPGAQPTRSKGNLACYETPSPPETFKGIRIEKTAYCFLSNMFAFAVVDSKVGPETDKLKKLAVAAFGKSHRGVPGYTPWPDPENDALVTAAVFALGKKGERSNILVMYEPLQAFGEDANKK
jgi:hypothetical protein